MITASVRKELIVAKNALKIHSQKSNIHLTFKQMILVLTKLTKFTLLNLVLKHRFHLLKPLQVSFPPVYSQK